VHVKVGFIGLGNIGSPLARSLLDSGRHELLVHDLRQEAASELLARGAAWADSPAELAGQVDMVLTSLPGPREVRVVMEESGGVLEGLRPGSTWIELSTTDRTQLLRLAEQVATLGGTALECPVTGGVAKAHEGKATFFVGGDRAAYDRCKPVLDCMAEEIFYLGALGNAMTCKLITNLLVFAHEAILGEGLMIGALAGLDLPTLADAINGSFGASITSERHTVDIFDGSYDSKFSLGLALKDLDLVTERAAEVGAPLYVGALVRERFKEAAEMYGPDMGDLINVRLLEDETGTPLRAMTREQEG
jgi:3-hydroxyisobutyrate dehydrogenase